MRIGDSKVAYNIMLVKATDPGYTWDTENSLSGKKVAGKKKKKMRKKVKVRKAERRKRNGV